MKEKENTNGVSEGAGLISDKERRKTNLNGLIAVLLSAVIIAVFFLGYFVRGVTEPTSWQTIKEIVKIIEDKAVWMDEMSADDLAEQLVNKLLVDDKYAKYYSPEEYKRVLEEDQGSYSGVGIAFNTQGAIAQVNLNSPAYKAGIKVGDKLISGVYKKDVSSGDTKKYTSFAVKLGEEQKKKPEKTIFDVYGEFFADFDLGEEFDLLVRSTNGQNTEVRLKKDNYIVSYVEYYDCDDYLYFSTEKETVEEKGKPVEKELFGARVKEGQGKSELSEDTAYIKLYAFEGSAGTQFTDALDYMKAQGKSKLILDLRDNGGGLITVLTEIASCLLNDNGSPKIKIMKVKEKFAEKYYYTDSNNFYDNITAISIIANGSTASASEALIGALNDYGYRKAHGGATFNLENLVLTDYNTARGTYCTYGKGIMQTTYGLTSGGALMLTTAYIYWPKEPFVCVQDVGITTPLVANHVADGYAITRADQILHPLPAIEEDITE